jgi:hypothetical protein
MNILILLIGVIISLTYFMSFVWEMKQEKILKEKELRDNKYYYARNMSRDKKKQPKRKKGSQSRIKNYNLKK